MKTSKSLLSLVAIASLTVGLLGQGAYATPLPPGAAVPPPNLIPNPFTNGATLQPGGFLNSPYFAPGNLSGSVQSWAFRESLLNNPLGGLTFVYLVNNSPGMDPVERFTVGGYTGFTLDASQSSGPGSVPFPAGLSDSDLATRTLNGDVVGFNFTAANAIPAGDSSYYLIVRSNAQSFSFIDGGVIDNAGATVRVITASIPEGGSALALLGLALVAVEALRRKLAA